MRSLSSTIIGQSDSLEIHVFLTQLLVEASVKRVVNLASQWEKHRAPLIDEHRRLKELCSNQDVSGAFLQIAYFICCNENSFEFCSFVTISFSWSLPESFWK